MVEDVRVSPLVIVESIDDIGHKSSTYMYVALVRLHGDFIDVSRIWNIDTLESGEHKLKVSGAQSRADLKRHEW